MAFDVNHARRAYRAMVAKLDLSDEERRDLNERFTGHRSSTEFDEAEWQTVLAELQRLTGRPGVRPGHPHLRGERPLRHDLPHPLDSGCRPEQAAYIRDLAAQVAWRNDPATALRILIVNHAFRKNQRIQGEQWERGNGTIESLPRDVASLLIRILKRMARATVPQ